MDIPFNEQHKIRIRPIPELHLRFFCKVMLDGEQIGYVSNSPKYTLVYKALGHHRYLFSGYVKTNRTGFSPYDSNHKYLGRTTKNFERAVAAVLNGKNISKQEG